MMYASISAYMHDKKNSVSLYGPPKRSPSLATTTGNKKQAPPRPPYGKSMSMSMMGESSSNSAPADDASAMNVADLHAAVLASHQPPKRMHSLEDEMRELDAKDSGGSGVVSVLSVETSTDSMLVKLLNYLKDHKVGIVKIRKESLFEGISSRKSSIGSINESPRAASPDREMAERQMKVEAEGANKLEEATLKEIEKLEPFLQAEDEEPKAKGTASAQPNPTISVHPDEEKQPLRRQMSHRYDVFVNLQEDGKRLNELLVQIEQQVGGVRYRRSRLRKQTHLELKAHGGNEVEVSPGFPMRIDELDITSKHVLMYGADLDADHPGFKDPEYRRRRMMFGQIALQYRYGQQLPRVDYSESEKRTWATVYKELMRLYPDYACSEFLTNMHLLQQEALYSENDVPQLPDVSKFLKSRSGFQLRPVAGYLSPRDFLAGLAFRVFHTTQYIRHPSEPFYSPEPDCCHELLGHVPMLADPEFAQFSQEIGLASLGASEEDIKKLAILYFFTIEFGLCRDALMTGPSKHLNSVAEQSDGMGDDLPPLRVYGAGLLSCVAELKHVLSEESTVKKFEPEDAINTECMITTFQETYFYNNSFQEAVEDVRRFADAIKKPFTVRYNPYTESLEIIDNVRRVERLISELRQDATILTAALRRLGYDGNIRHLTGVNTIEDLP